MDRVIQDLPALLARLVLFGPLIYLGLHILLNPALLAGVLSSAMDGIERFPHALRGHARLPLALGRRPGLPLAALRWAGLVLTAYGVLCLSGLGRP